MKKVLLTTTALVMTAGVASAEITFSGKGEAGVYRTAPTAATTGTASRLTTVQARGTIAAGTSGAAISANATADIVGFDATGELVIVANSNATNAGAPANATAVGVAPTDNSLDEQKMLVLTAKAAVATAQTAVDGLTDASTNTAIDTAYNNLAIAQAELAAAELVLALHWSCSYSKRHNT
jgi:hypothetical protein